MEKTSNNTSNVFTLLEENAKSSGRSLGRQLGHKSVSRYLLSEEQVNRIVPCYPSWICLDCGGTVEVQKQVARSQVYNLPILGFELTAYQVYQSCCSSCQQLYRRALFSESGQRGFGIQPHAFIGLFTSKFRISKWQVVHALKGIYGLPTNMGSISNMAECKADINSIWIWLLKAYDALFKFWKTGSRARWLYHNKNKKQLHYLKNDLLKQLQYDVDSAHAATRRRCQNILDCRPSLWRLLEVPRVKPANNVAEQQLRALVLTKKFNFDLKPDQDSHFIEYPFSLIGTC